MTEQLEYADLDLMVDTDPIELRDKAWAEISRLRGEVAAERARAERTEAELDSCGAYTDPHTSTRCLRWPGHQGDHDHDPETTRIRLLAEVERLSTPAPTLDFATFAKAIIGARYQWMRLKDSIDMAAGSAHWIEEWTPLRFTVNGAPVDVHRSLNGMRRLMEDLGVLEDEGDQNPFPMIVTSREGAICVPEVVDRWGRASTETREAVGVWLCAALDALAVATGARVPRTPTKKR